MVEGIKGSSQFESPEAELEYLRNEVARREEVLRVAGKRNSKEVAVHQTVALHTEVNANDVLHPGYKADTAEIMQHLLHLSPETHDTKMEELAHLVETRGIKNALAVVMALKNPHVFDDFHRFLVQYVAKGLPGANTVESAGLGPSMRMTLFEVSVPARNSDSDTPRPLKELLSGMEQFYSGMLSIIEGDKKEYSHFTIEIANANGSDEFIFYVSVPSARRDLFEKQLLSVFKGAKIKEQADDYNIFAEGGETVGAVATTVKSPIFPIKTYDLFDVDPLNVVLNSFSKIKTTGEGAALQLVFQPQKDFFTKKYEYALHRLEKGVPTNVATDIPLSIMGEFGAIVKDISHGGAVAKHSSDGSIRLDERAIESVKRKLQTPIVTVNIRLVASASDRKRAESILSDLESAFNQFQDPAGGAIRFSRVGRFSQGSFFRSFSLRQYDRGELLPLNLKEIATLVHFPPQDISAPQLKVAKTGSAPAPTGLPSMGTLLGINRDRGSETPIYMTREDRLRHLYVIGQTGTGKTTLLKNMIVQDIQNGEGVCFIDPHGTDVEDILASVPKERYNDVIYFDPSNTARPMALNMLEYDPRFPEQKTFVVNEMLSIFDKLFDMKTSGGPMFEQYFRNSVLLTIEDPETGSTLLDVSRVLSNKAFRELKLSRIKNPIISQFWREIADKAGGEASLQNIVPYVVSKFDNFLTNDIMRPVIAQERSSLIFRDIMDQKKILLVNLAKGRLGDLNAHLIGLILVGKIFMAALSRVDALGQNLPDFYLYIDEFQNVTTPTVSAILSEARKYKLSLNIAHQFVKQIDEKIKDAVFGNVGSMAVFRVGAEDSEFLAKQFEPVFTPEDLLNADNRNAFMKLLVNGRPVRPFNIETIAPVVGDRTQGAKLKELSALTYGRPREEVEAEIMEKYKK